MAQIKIQEKQIIYFDVTAGRGSYDDDYLEGNIDTNQIHNKNVSVHNINESENKEKPYEYRATFKNFNDYQTKQLPKQNFNDISSQRRHSYSRGPPKGRATGRNYPPQSSNYNYENNRYHANRFKDDYKTDYPAAENNNKSADNVKINWYPKLHSKV